MVLPNGTGDWELEGASRDDDDAAAYDNNEEHTAKLTTPSTTDRRRASRDRAGSVSRTSNENPALLNRSASVLAKTRLVRLQQCALHPSPL